MVTVMSYEQYLHYRRGQLVGVVGPGEHRFWGSGHDFVRIDTRVRLFDVKPQEVPTSDGITVKVNASAHLRVTDPVSFHEVAEDPHAYLYDAVKAWLRVAVHARTLDEVVAGIDVSETPAEILAAAASVGLEITDFAVRDVVVPAEIRHGAQDLVTARQRSQVALEQARSEVAVLRALANSAKVLEDHPTLAALRLAETAATHGGTVIIERPTS